jgi:hypothetical protein
LADADRNRCLEDVRKALEKYHIGWCMWDYASAFGVATGNPGQRVPDADTVKALGLAPPQAGKRDKADNAGNADAHPEQPVRVGMQQH